MANMDPILLSEDIATKEKNVKKLIEAQKTTVIESKHVLPDLKISNRYAGLKVYGLVADESACGYYRVILPLQMLKAHGADVKLSSVGNYYDIMAANVIIAPRQHNDEIYELIRDAMWEKKTVVYEIDDNLDFVLPSSPAYSVYHKGSEPLKTIPRIVRNCFGVTTTTPECARWYHQWNRNTVVIENFIDFSLRDWGVDVNWRGETPVLEPKPIGKPKCWKDKTVILWSGGTTHQSDLLEIGPSIKQVLDKYPQTVFAFYGSVEMAISFAKTNNLPLDRTYRIPARHFLDYPQGLFGADIGLAPIMPCEFNSSKSFLRLLELGAAGIAPVATNFFPYARFNKRHPGHVLMVGDGKTDFESWSDAIGHLVENPDELHEIKARNRQTVISEYALENNFHRWPVAWGLIVDEVRKGSLGPPLYDKPREFYKSTGKVDKSSYCSCGSGKKAKACCGYQAWG